MQVNVENVSPVKKKLTFEIPADRVASEIDKAYGKIKKNAAIKGFRKGKVPQSLVEKYFSDRMEEDVLRSLFNETFYKALYDQKINPVSQPVIEGRDLKKGESFTYSAVVEVLPEIDVKEYQDLAVKKEKFVEKEDVIEERLKQMQESMAQLKPVSENRAAALGDHVLLDFTGYVDDKPIEHGSAQDFTLELGSNRFIPGFEDQIVGMKAGEEGTIAVSFPEAYSSKELAGKAAKFEVKIKEIKVKELPPLDDDFAKQVGEFETLDQLKSKMIEVYRNQETERIENDLRDRVVKALVEKNELEVPESMIQKQLQYMLENMKNRLSMQRMSLEMMGLDDEKFKTRYHDEAELQVKGMLLLDSLAQKQEIVVDDGEIDAKIADIAAKTGQKLDVVKKFYQQDRSSRENLAAQLREDKAIAFLLEKAKVTEVEREKL